MKIMRERRGLPGSANTPEAERFLPVRPGVFAVLAVLGEGPKTGVQILSRLDEIGSRILGPGTLYRLLRELRQQRVIERVAAPSGAAVEDDRQQFHALSPLGERVLQAEAERLRRTLAVAGAGERSRWP